MANVATTIEGQRRGRGHLGTFLPLAVILSMEALSHLFLYLMVMPPDEHITLCSVQIMFLLSTVLGEVGRGLSTPFHMLRHQGLGAWQSLIL